MAKLISLRSEFLGRRISVRIAGHNRYSYVDHSINSRGARGTSTARQAAGQLELSQLKMNQQVGEGYKKSLARPHGIILVTDPRARARPRHSTPVYPVSIKPRVTSLRLKILLNTCCLGLGKRKPKVAMTFARSLRAILRQDPDVVMVGEIRDLETAEIAGGRLRRLGAVYATH